MAHHEGSSSSSSDGGGGGAGGPPAPKRPRRHSDEEKKGDQGMESLLEPLLFHRQAQQQEEAAAAAAGFPRLRHTDPECHVRCVAYDCRRSLIATDRSIQKVNAINANANMPAYPIVTPCDQPINSVNQPAIKQTQMK